MAEHDRRVRRTRRILHEALTTLVLEKGYEHITIQDILDRADVGRSTFYAHFRDKEALLVACFDGMRDELHHEFAAMTPDTGADPAGPAAVVFHHAHRHRSVYKALCGKTGGNLVYRHLNRLIGDLMREHLQPRLAAAGPDLPADVVAEFYTNATLGLLMWWINHDFRYGPTRIAAMHQRLTAPGMRAALGNTPIPAAVH
jgi:AcrR family transcriptional regulator